MGSTGTGRPAQRKRPPLTYVERCLGPALDRGDIVIMDNLPTHKVAGVTQAIEAADAMAIYLPAYSPDLNPIEQVSQRTARSRRSCWRAPPVSAFRSFPASANFKTNGLLRRVLISRFGIAQIGR
jgi:hypothetical protein